MKTKFTAHRLTCRAALLLLGMVFANVNFSLVLAQGTAFTYQGRLNDGASPANGIYDLMFSLFGLNSGGAAITGPLTNTAVTVNNGLFVVTLDFGNQFPGTNRWLEIGVRTNGGAAFTTLNPRQALTAAPYAITANNVTGPVSAAQLPATVLTNGSAGVNLVGTFNGNGAGVTNLNLAASSAGSIVSAGSFVFASSASVGDRPLGLVSADVNSDGWPDVITVNYNAQTLSVVTNNRSGGFVLAQSPAIGLNPRAVAAADLNGDGKVDLVSANFGANTLSVFTNNGSGTFVAAGTLTSGAGPWSVVAADVNNDDRVDIISANYVASTVSIFVNNGSGGFVSTFSPAVGIGPRAIIAADVNGDGKPDLITASFVDNTLSVLTNNGSGGFGLAASPPVGNAPESVAAADVNGDGRVDLISANTDNGSGNTLTVLTNGGGATFSVSSTPLVGPGPTAVVAADVNADGKVDLMSANRGLGNGTLSVLTNNGSGGFALAESPVTSSGPVALVAADVNRDGRPDLISAHEFLDQLTVLFNRVTFNGIFNGVLNGTYNGPVMDSQLSVNIARLNTANTFTATNVFTRRVGIGNSFNDPFNTPAATLDVDDSIRVGGTVIRNWQAGVAQMSTDSATVKTNFTFAFPKAYSTVPRVLVSGRADPNQNVDDTFAVSVRRVTTTNCTVNITRTDVSAGWGQHVQVTWMAWE